MNPVPRFWLWGFFLGLGLHVGASTSQAQVPPPPAPEPQINVLVVEKDSTKQVEMSSKLKIAQVRNENPKVARVQTIADNPFAILVTGLSEGSTRLTLVDERKQVEALDIRVPEDFEVQAEKQRKKFLEQVHKVVPTASINVVTPGANTVILSGTATDIQTVHYVLDLARSIFGGANVINYIQLGGVQQVQLEVVVALVNRSEARNLAFNFFNNRGDFFFNSFLSPPVAAANALSTGVASASSSGSGTANIAFGVLNSKNGFAGYINALRTEGLAKILAEPRVVTLSGKPAYIVSGGEAPVVLSNISGSSVTYKQFGTVVNFLPLVLGNGKIHLEVRPELSSINAGVSVTTGGTNPISAPGFDTRSAQVAVQMEDGQTLAIGGLIQNRVNSETRKVPIFGDLPFIGAAFRTVNMTESEEELLILVTPRLIDPLACNQLPKHLPGRETRTTDDFELFLEGIMEAPRGQRDVFPDGRYLPVHRNGETAAMYPCGDSPNPHIGKHRCRHCTNPNCSGVHTAPYSVSGNGHTAYRNPNGDSEAGIPAAGFPAPGTPVNILGPTSVPAPGSLPTSGAPGSFPPPPFGVSPGLGNRPPEGF